MQTMWTAVSPLAAFLVTAMEAIVSAYVLKRLSMFIKGANVDSSTSRSGLNRLNHLTVARLAVDALSISLMVIAVLSGTAATMHPIGICGFSLAFSHIIFLALFFEGTRALKIGSSPIESHSLKKPKLTPKASVKKGKSEFDRSNPRDLGETRKGTIS